MCICFYKILLCPIRLHSQHFFLFSWKLSIGPHRYIAKAKLISSVLFILFRTSGYAPRGVKGHFIRGELNQSYIIVVNLPGTYEKLPRKGEPYRFSGQRDSPVQTNSPPVTFIMKICCYIFVVLNLQGITPLIYNFNGIGLHPRKNWLSSHYSITSVFT